MAHTFDLGPVEEPFASLVADYPGTDTYPASGFRVEWGPIFHRGRLDGSARLLVIGQDPAQSETIVRRILVGEAGHRSQGLMAKLGITRSYLLMNTYLYSVYGQTAGEQNATNKDIAKYRHRWLDAIFASNQIDAVIALGHLADTAWQTWKRTTAGRRSRPPTSTSPTRHSQRAARAETEPSSERRSEPCWPTGTKRSSNSTLSPTLMCQDHYCRTARTSRRASALRSRSSTCPPACQTGCAPRAPGQIGLVRPPTPSDETSPSQSPPAWCSDDRANGLFGGRSLWLCSVPTRVGMTVGPVWSWCLGNGGNPATGSVTNTPDQLPRLGGARLARHPQGESCPRGKADTRSDGSIKAPSSRSDHPPREPSPGRPPGSAGSRPARSGTARPRAWRCLA